MKPNIFMIVWDLNQSAQPITKKHCPIFSFWHNILFNTWIWIDYKDEEEMANRCKKLWLLTDEFWWSTKCFEVCFDYIQELKKTPWNKLYNAKPDIKLIKTTKWSPLYKELIKNNYVARVGAEVNLRYLEDVIDWKIDTLDYNKLKWTFWHFFNAWDMTKNYATWDYIIDNYFGKRLSLIKCDLKELEKIMFKTVYSVIPL